MPNENKQRELEQELKCFRALPQLIQDCLIEPDRKPSLLASIKPEMTAEFENLMLLIGLTSAHDSTPYKVQPEEDLIKSWVDCAAMYEYLSGESSETLK